MNSKITEKFKAHKRRKIFSFLAHYHFKILEAFENGRTSSPSVLEFGIAQNPVN